jgi:predicted metal-dependent hydrolase
LRAFELALLGTVVGVDLPKRAHSQILFPSAGDSPKKQVRQVDTMMAGQHNPLYLQGIEHFNAGEFFEAHEVWEELWADYSGPDRKFYQGLIQAAVALHHFNNGNIRGARKLLYTSCGYLTPYQPRHEGLDVDKLVHDMRLCFADVIADETEFPQVEINPDLIPEIHLEPDSGI